MSPELIVTISISVLTILISLFCFIIMILERRRSDTRQFRNEEYLRQIMFENRKNDNSFDGSLSIRRGFSDDYEDVSYSVKRLSNEVSRLRLDLKKTVEINGSNIDSRKLVEEIISNTSTELLKAIDGAKFSNMLLQEIVGELSFEHFKELKNSNLDSKMRDTYKTIQHIQHILRTPLSGIKICLQSLLEKNNNENEEELRQIESSLNIIESNLIVLSSFQPEIFDSQDISFKDRLNSYINLLLLTSDKKMNLNLDNMRDDILITNNINDILLCIACIVENALSFAPDNSELKIQCDYVDNVYTFSVTNYGSCIPLDVGRKIFEDGYSSRGSTGIGLNLAQKIVQEKLNGKIDYKNLENPEGVEFFFTMEE